jgi:hypothetical protein
MNFDETAAPYVVGVSEGVNGGEPLPGLAVWPTAVVDCVCIGTAGAYRGVQYPSYKLIASEMSSVLLEQLLVTHVDSYDSAMG